jgi:hypothetical protein
MNGDLGGFPRKLQDDSANDRNADAFTADRRPVRA